MSTSEAIFVQGDNEPDLTAQLHRRSDPTVPIDLTGCSVKMQMRRPDDRLLTVDAAASVTNPSQGLVSYTWAANDLAVPGDYEVQWRITYADARIETTPVTNKILVRRR